MPTVKRRKRRFQRDVFGSMDQLTYVEHGLEFPGYTPLTKAEFESLWWRIRTEALERANVGSRPHGWWVLEAKSAPFPWERDSDALIRLRVPLTAKERFYLERERPSGPFGDGLPHFSNQRLLNIRRCLECRRDWHAEEGRAEMADAYAGRAAEVDQVLADRQSRGDPGPLGQYWARNINHLAKE